MFFIRPSQAIDDESVNILTASTTCELRAVYAPKHQPAATNPATLTTRIVVLDHEHTIVGVAEYFALPSALYAQGIAVAATHRRRGIATALLNHIENIARKMHLPAVQIKTILETGNAAKFHQMGFQVMDERVSERFIGLQGQPVTEVKMQRYVRPA